MNEQEKQLIRETLQTRGWLLIEALLQEEANTAKKIRVAGLDYQTIAVEAIANEKLSTAVKSLLRRLNTIKNDTRKEGVIYK